MDLETELIHFCGIGGIGLSGIAQILKSKGYKVQGSDIYENENTIRLSKLGIEIFTPQKKENLKGVSIFVYSSAVSDSNPEYVEAKEKKIQILKRHEILNEITKLYFTISVSGTHGKTTTTGIVSSMFEAAEKQPTILIGGILQKHQNNAVIRDSPYLVLEADESDETFVKINSNISIITNIDVEHLDYYKSYEKIIEAFQKYESNVPENGCLIYCQDHPISKQIGDKSKKNKFSYGIKESSDVEAQNIRYFEGKTLFDVLYNSKLILENVEIPLRGEHNVLNSLAAISVSLFMKFSKDSMRFGLLSFGGVQNRSEFIGNVAGVQFFRDYAHHPKEIYSTTRGFKNLFKKNQKLICLHEPHRFNRVFDLWNEYIDCFVEVDYLFIKNVSPLIGEIQIGEANSKSLTQAIQLKYPKLHCLYFEDYQEIFDQISIIAEKNDILLFLGSKDIQNDSVRFMNQLKNMFTIDFPELYPTARHIKNVGKGSTFVVPTINHAGSIPIAIEKGAKKIVLHQDFHHEIFQKLCNDQNVEYIFDENPSKALAFYSSQNLDHPSKKLKIIGITGTNGKSTTTNMIEFLLRKSGKRVGLIGGIENKICGISLGKSELTTPQSDYIHMFFNECLKRNVEFVVMEVSSQGIELNRVDGIEFSCIGFTNLSQDHLDFHKTMDNYFESKMKCFQQLKPNGFFVINNDCDWGKKALKSFVKNDQKVLKINSDTIDESILQSSKNLESPIYGVYNAYNMMMAKSICQEFNVSIPFELINAFPGVPGRLKKHYLKNKSVGIVDFAHSPDAIENVLRNVKNDTNDLIVVFGAGGDRDKGKRELMGSMAEKYANKIILTSDNPRSENPLEIVKDIIKGIQNETLFIIELDRSKAIEMAANISTKGSIITILGKGHEDYMIIGNQKFHFDDFEEISKY
jgi:UDP-N-acetylmuramate--alanine ligase